MMRPVTLAVDRAVPDAPDPLVVSGSPGSPVTLDWTDASPARTGLTVMSSFETTAEVGFRVERALLSELGEAGGWKTIGTAPANSETYTDLSTVDGKAYRYRVVAFNASEDPTLQGASNTVDITPATYVESYEVTPTAGFGGTISPASPVAVPVGSPADVTFTFTPDPDWHVTHVMVDGAMVMPMGNTYTLPAVAANHEIMVHFAPDTHTITPSVIGTGGTIWWDSAQSSQDGTIKTFAFTPDPGYRVAEVRVDGVPVTRPTYGGKQWDFYTFTDIQTDHTIAVSFELNTYTITPSASAGGTIAPSTPQSVAFGADSPTFSMTPDPGYHLSELRVDGVLVPTVSTYTFTGVTADHTIAATFTSDRMQPVYRFFSPRSGAHFYTASAAERDSVATNLAGTWSYEGTAYTLNLDNPANADPLHRFLNRADGTHFYTASATEHASVAASLSHIYTYEGVAYLVSAAGGTGTMPVYRFYNVRTGSHFYTISDVERDSVIANLSGTFTYEGAAFHIGY